MSQAGSGKSRSGRLGSKRGRAANKEMIIMIKDIERKLKLALEKNEKNLSESQQASVRDIINSQTMQMQVHLNQLQKDVSSDRKDTLLRLDKHEDGIEQINKLG